MGRERHLHPPIELSHALSSKLKDSTLAGSYQAFPQDCLEHVIQKVYSDLHHVYHWRRLVGLREVDLIEVVDVAALVMVGENMVHSVLIDRTHTHQIKRKGLWHALCQGEEWSVLNSTPFWSCRDHQIFILTPRTMCTSRVLGISGMVTLECRNFVACSRSKTESMRS